MEDPIFCMGIIHGYWPEGYGIIELDADGYIFIEEGISERVDCLRIIFCILRSGLY